jgi:hypothetical protein
VFFDMAGQATAARRAAPRLLAGHHAGSLRRIAAGGSLRSPWGRTSASDFATGTQGMTSVVEDFTRDKSGAAVPADYFSTTYGDHYYRSDTILFISVGVQPADAPGTLSETITGAYGSIMSDAGGTQARDGIVANFSTEQRAVGLVLNDDEGSQTFTLLITSSNGTSYTFTATAGKSTFLGVIDRCSTAIPGFRILPPAPSHWWRLESVTFAH